jgi:CRP/FNR family transcriptional regulator, nitrogen oxide reductase regulator
MTRPSNDERCEHFRKVACLVKAVDQFRCLGKSKLFQGLDDTALKEIFDAARLRHVAPKTDIIVNGGKPDHLFLLQKGRVRSHLLTDSGSDVVLLWVVPGGVLGLASLLASPPTYMTTATTVSECEFLVWNHDTIRRLAKAYPQLTENGLGLALYYLRRYMKRHINIVTKSAEARLAHGLLRLASEAGVVQSPGIAIDITNEQLSSLSDISPFTASRLLSRWEHEHWLTKQRGRVTLLAPEDLEALVAA